MGNNSLRRHSVVVSGEWPPVVRQCPLDKLSLSPLQLREWQCSLYSMFYQSVDVPGDGFTENWKFLQSTHYLLSHIEINSFLMKTILELNIEYMRCY